MPNVKGFEVTARKRLFYHTLNLNPSHRGALGRWLSRANTRSGNVIFPQNIEEVAAYIFQSIGSIEGDRDNNLFDIDD